MRGGDDLDPPTSTPFRPPPNRSDPADPFATRQPLRPFAEPWRRVRALPAHGGAMRARCRIVVSGPGRSLSLLLLFLGVALAISDRPAFAWGMVAYRPATLDIQQ